MKESLENELDSDDEPLNLRLPKANYHIVESPTIEKKLWKEILAKLKRKWKEKAKKKTEEKKDEKEKENAKEKASKKEEKKEIKPGETEFILYNLHYILYCLQYYASKFYYTARFQNHYFNLLD